jgi:putative peptidoglycan lipid II flippase
MFWWFGHVGLALATTVSAWVHLWLLFRGIRSRDYYQPTRDLMRFTLASVVAGAAMGVVLAAFAPADAYWLSIGTWARIAWLTGLVLAGAASYGVTVWLAGVRPAEMRHHV